MAKRKRKLPTTISRIQRTPGKVLRRGGFLLREIQAEDGKISIDIDPLDSEIRTSGRPGLLDNVYYMMKFQIMDQCENLRESIGDSLVIRDKKDAEMVELIADNIAQKQKLDSILKCVLSIKTGKGGNTIKDDPYEIRKSLLELLA